METAGRLYNTLANLDIAPLTQQTLSVRYCEDLGWGVWYKYEEDGNYYLQRAHTWFAIGMALSPESSANLWGISVVKRAVFC